MRKQRSKKKAGKTSASGGKGSKKPRKAKSTPTKARKTDRDSKARVIFRGKSIGTVSFGAVTLTSLFTPLSGLAIGTAATGVCAASMATSASAATGI